jgi:Winged helix DNA-binding domain
MSADVRFTDQDRRARLAERHLLAPSAPRTVEQISRALVAMHATDPATVFLSVGTRSADVSPTGIEDALYRERSLYRILAMRRTMFVVNVDAAALVDAAAAQPVATKMRRDVLARLADGGWDQAKLAGVESAVVAALREHGPATGTQLRTWVPELAEQVVFAPGTKYETKQAVSSLVIRLIAAENRILRDRPRGTWSSSQFRWALPTRSLGVIDPAQARRALVSWWLRAYGPATEADLKWWTGWTLRDVRAALADLDTVAVEFDGGPGIGLTDDVGTSPPVPWVALLPALDPTPMGWKNRDWFLPASHRGELFDYAGNVGPTVWVDGRIVGGWAQRGSGEVVYELLEDVAADREAEIAAEAERLRTWIGDVRVTPRFRTPVERRLTSAPT